MIGLLRFVGVLNAAVWFGGAIFFTFGVGTAAFSSDMKALLGANNYPYFSGAIAQILIARYFGLQTVCSVIACLHLLAEWSYMGKPLRQCRFLLVAGLCVVAWLGSFWLQPKMKALHAVKYNLNNKLEVRETAARSFRAWHGASMAANLFMVVGLGVYLWRTANPTDPTRLVTSIKFRS